MSTETVEIQAQEGIFEGLAKQNLKFHQCVAELVDNAIASSSEQEKFTIEIAMNRDENDESVVHLWISDNCGGMTLDIFKAALQPGEPATTESRLNEHGFGMKNSLATLSDNNGYWKVWTTPDEGDSVFSTEGPFEKIMEVDNDSRLPDEDFLPTDVSTVIHVPVNLSFIQTVQGRGAPAKDLSKLRSWLVEHLGVFYRGFLGVDPGPPDGSISVWIGGDRQHVQPIQVPMANSDIEYFDIELGGGMFEIEYEFGTLDEHRVQSVVDGGKAKAYYQGNQRTQGIDIRLGSRTIATNQLSNIWNEEGGETQLETHNRFNDFIGELRIPGDVPRGTLTTTNDKTDFNLDDDGWRNIFDRLNEDDKLRPIEKARTQTEKQLREDWIQKLEDTRPDDELSDERHVWPPGTRVDVFQETNNGRVIIYELKAGSGTPQNLYQLMMYWDGLVLEDTYPDKGILLVEDYGSNLESMANMINKELSPPGESSEYNIIIQKHSERGLE